MTVHLGTPPRSLHGSLRIKFKSTTAYQATVNSLKESIFRLITVYNMVQLIGNVESTCSILACVL